MKEMILMNCNFYMQDLPNLQRKSKKYHNVKYSNLKTHVPLLSIPLE